jgi:squalene monooxygenase
MSRSPGLLNADVAVVGAGPVGCVAAIALARHGMRVVLLEAGPAGRRFAGEWLHPAAVDVLRELAIPLPPNAQLDSARGFIVFPEDGSAPIDGRVAPPSRR